MGLFPVYLRLHRLLLLRTCPYVFLKVCISHSGFSKSKEFPHNRSITFLGRSFSSSSLVCWDASFCLVLTISHSSSILLAVLTLTECTGSGQVVKLSCCQVLCCSANSPVCRGGVTVLTKRESSRGRIMQNKWYSQMPTGRHISTVTQCKPSYCPTLCG